MWRIEKETKEEIQNSDHKSNEVAKASEHWDFVRKIEALQSQDKELIDTLISLMFLKGSLEKT